MDRITERKRIFLESYTRLGEQLKEIDIKIADLVSLQSPRLDGMPHGNFISGDLSVMASLIEEYREERVRIVERRKAIEQAIRRVDDPDERLVLHLRYIRNMPLLDICECSDLNYDKIKRLHQKALQHIVISLDVPTEI